MVPKGPITGTSGIWYAYLQDQEIPGNGADAAMTMHGQDAYGNTTLFESGDSGATSGVILSTLSLVWVEVWFRQASEILADREVAISLNSGEKIRGRAKVVGNYAEARYQGVFSAGETILPITKATSDTVSVRDGYMSVIATPI
jgi:hypothetical protein